MLVTCHSLLFRHGKLQDHHCPPVLSPRVRWQIGSITARLEDVQMAANPVYLHDEDVSEDVDQGPCTAMPTSPVDLPRGVPAAVPALALEGFKRVSAPSLGRMTQGQKSFFVPDSNGRCMST